MFHRVGTVLARVMDGQTDGWICHSYYVLSRVKSLSSSYTCACPHTPACMAFAGSYSWSSTVISYTFHLLVDKRKANKYIQIKLYTSSHVNLAKCSVYLWSRISLSHAVTLFVSALTGELCRLWLTIDGRCPDNRGELFDDITLLT